MDSKIVDVTRLQKNTVWRRRLTEVCVLEKAFSGTFCFEWGPEFGCGSTFKISAGESRSLKGGFSKGGVSTEASVTYTQGSEWSHPSGRCEWCKPIVCYLNSSLRSWNCETFLDGTSWTDRRVTFTPGRAQLFPNCEVNNEKCKCSGQQAAIPGHQGVSYEPQFENSKVTVLISTIGMESRPGKAKRNAEKDLQDAHAMVEGFAEPTTPDDAKPTSVLIRAPDGGIISLDALHPDSENLAILSVDCIDQGRGAMRVRPDGFITVFAAAPFIENARAFYEIRLHKDGMTQTLVKEEAAVATGRFTTVWEQFKLPDDFLQPEVVAELVVKIFDCDNHPVAQTCQNIRGSFAGAM